MKISEGRKRIIRYAGRIILFLLFSLAFDTAVFAADISMTVTYGYRNTAGSGEALPITVLFENSADPVEGFIVIEVTGDTGTLSFAYPCDVPSGGSSRKCTVTIPAEYSRENGDSLFVRLIDDQGEEITGKKADVSYYGNGNAVLCGILSNDPENLVYFGNASLSNGMVCKTVSLNPADIPQDPEGLSQLEVIIVSSFDEEELSEESADSILGFAAEGGTLLIDGTAFSDKISGLSFGAEETEDINMGVEYSSKGPDDAVIKVRTREVMWDDSHPLLDKGSISLFRYMDYGDGRIIESLVSLKDLCDFCLEHEEFTEELYESMLGREKLFSLTGEKRLPDTRIESVKASSNTFNEEKSPELFVYLFIACLYLILAGPVLFYFLKSRGLGIFYAPGIVLLSTVFAFVIWMASAGTRFQGPYADYGSVVRVLHGSGSVSMETAVKTGNPGRKAVTVELPGDAQIKPVAVRGDVTVTGGKTKMLAFTGQEPFEENSFYITSFGSEDLPCEPFAADVSLFETSFRGTVRNESPYPLTGILLCQGSRVMKLPDLLPGEEADLTGCEIISGPLKEAVYYAEGISENSADQKKGLLNEVLNELEGESAGSLKLIGFADALVPSYLKNQGLTLNGTALIVYSFQAGSTEEGYLNLLSGGTPEHRGAYTDSGNTLTKNQAAVITYSPGTDLLVTGLLFEDLSEVLYSDDLIAFSGEISIYNYRKGRYDTIASSKERIEGDMIESYLSPANNMNLRFIPQGDRDDVRMYLPVPFAVTEKKETEPFAPSLPEE